MCTTHVTFRAGIYRSVYLSSDSERRFGIRIVFSLNFSTEHVAQTDQHQIVELLIMRYYENGVGKESYFY